MSDLCVARRASIDAALLADTELVTDAETSSLSPPNWMNPILIDGPQIDGVVINHNIPMVSAAYIWHFRYLIPSV